MRTVVTGACGHVGANLVRLLREAGHQVTAIDLLRGPALAGLDVDFVPASILDPGLGEVFGGTDVVFHLAARISIASDPDGSVRAVNVGGVANVAQAALKAGVARFVHCSSVHAFDIAGCHSTVVDERSPRSVSAKLPAYDRSKAAGEQALHAVEERGLDAVIVNPTGIIGPCDFGPSRMGRFFLAVRDGRLPALVAGRFDWVDVRDVAAAILSAADRGRRGENYLLPGHRATMTELAVLVRDAIGVAVPRLVVPMPMARALADALHALGRTSQASLLTGESLHALRADPRVDGTKAERELGHHPRALRETVGDLMRWFENEASDPGGAAF